MQLYLLDDDLVATPYALEYGKRKCSHLEVSAYDGDVYIYRELYSEETYVGVLERYGEDGLLIARKVYGQISFSYSGRAIHPPRVLSDGRVLTNPV